MSDADEPQPPTKPSTKLDRKTLLVLVSFAVGMILLIVLNMK